MLHCPLDLPMLSQKLRSIIGISKKKHTTPDMCFHYFQQGSHVRKNPRFFCCGFRSEPQQLVTDLVRGILNEWLCIGKTCFSIDDLIFGVNPYFRKP